MTYYYCYYLVSVTVEPANIINTYLLVGCFFRWSRDDKRTCAWSIISAQAIFCWVISLRAGLRLLLPALLCQTPKRIWEESTSYYDCIYRRQQSSSTSYVLINTWQQTFCDCGLHTLVRVLGVPIWCPVGKYRFGGIGTWIPNNRSLLPNFNFESPSSTAARSKQQNASLTCRTSMADIFQARNLEEA